MGSEQATAATKPTFEECSTEILTIIGRRRSSWTYLSLMEWQDVNALLLERIWKKWHTYDPAKAKTLEHWVNRLITNALLNLRRDLYLRLAKPCIGGGKSNGKSCVFNLGGDSCSHTKSKKQCSECPLYAEWEKTREPQFKIKSNVSLEHHAQEVSNIQGDFSDINEIKERLDEAMKKELTPWEWHTYKAIYIEHLSPTQTSERLQAIVKTWKRTPRPEEQTAYQAVLQNKHRFEMMMKDVLRRAGHIN